MKILHVNKFFDLHGGAEVYMHRLIEQQLQRGHEVHALATRSDADVSTGDSDLFVRRNDYTRHEGPVRDAQKALSYLWNREAKRSMEDALRRYRPDIVHVHNIYHHLSTSILQPIRASGIPCVQTLHDLKLACPNYKMFTEGAPCERCKGGRYFEAVRHHCLGPSFSANALAAVEMGMTKLFQSYERTMKFFICPSQFMHDKMAAWGEPPSKLKVVPNPVELSDVSAERDGKYLLIASRLSPEKGIDTVIRAVADLPEVEVRVAGIGPMEASLRSLATSLKANNVVFLGFQRKAELQVLRRHARAVLVPTTMYENASTSALEAMGEGLPIIASRIGGLPELVKHHENGLLVEPQRPEAWASAMAELTQMSAQQLAAMGEKGRSFVEARHTWDGHLRALEQLYHEAGA